EALFAGFSDRFCPHSLSFGNDQRRLFQNYDSTAYKAPGIHVRAAAAWNHEAHRPVVIDTMGTAPTPRSLLSAPRWSTFTVPGNTRSIGDVPMPNFRQYPLLLSCLPLLLALHSPPSLAEDATHPTQTAVVDAPPSSEPGSDQSKPRAPAF